MSSFTKPADWDDMVSRVDTSEAFEFVMRAMFTDGKITPQRMLVLETFARDVGKTHPDISAEVMRHYNMLDKATHSRYSWLCWSNSRYDLPILIADVVDGLLSLVEV